LVPIRNEGIAQRRSTRCSHSDRSRRNCVPCLLLYLFTSMLCVALPSFPQGATPTEYQVKAAFLLNFAKFIEWPPEAFPHGNASITLCVFRYDPFGRALDDIIRGKTINERGVVARRINEPAGVKLCQLVFISDRDDKQLPEILDILKGSSALVVGESEDFARRGGGIQFFLEDNKLRFAINVDAVQKARLTLSSKLLALAKIIHDPGHQKEH
jgi:hypothetical protein